MKRIIEKGEPLPLTENVISWESGSRMVDMTISDPKLVEYLTGCDDVTIISKNKDGSIFCKVPRKSMVLLIGKVARI